MPDNSQSPVSSPARLPGSFPVETEKLHRQRVIAGMGHCDYLDAFKILRTRVLQKMRERSWNTLAVTSPNPQAGATLCAINLSLSLALEVNQNVLLVDANLRKPTVARYFGVNPQSGLADHLLDNVPVSAILLQPEGIGQLTLLPGSRPLHNAAELLSSPQMSAMAHTLKNEDPTRFIVYDLAHLQTADALAFIPQVDAVLMVILAGVTTRKELTQAIERLHGAPVVGTLLNQGENP